jgi:regulator of sigma E protease
MMSQFIISLIAFIVALGILVSVHEFGHFWVARRLGVKVLKFAIGFGKPLWRYQAHPDATEYVIAALPLGGYVKMLDEREGEVPPHDRHRAFNVQTVWKRIAIVAAGPVFNLLLAIILYAGVFVIGIPGLKPVVGEVRPDSYAALAGF